MEKQKEAIRKSETHVVKCVFPNTTNHYDTLLEGQPYNGWMKSLLLQRVDLVGKKWLQYHQIK